MEDVLVMILGGGRGTRLFPLTKHRSEPAVPIAGKYRLIDIPISNCINSHMSRIYVLTQYMSVSLHRHLANTYKFNPFTEGFVEVLAAQQTYERSSWFKGTADAIRQNLHYIRTDDCPDILVLSGDQLYRMDFGVMLNFHHQTQADVTISVLPVTADQAASLGIVCVDENLRITKLVEKPNPDQLANLKTPRAVLEKHGFPAECGEYLANMGIYFYRRESIMKLLETYPDADDFVTEILEPSLPNYNLQAYLFNGYWEDVGSIKTYYEANLVLTGDNPPFDFHGVEGVIYTRMRNLPASRVIHATLEHCVLSDGCVIEEGAELSNTVLGVRTNIGKRAKLRDVVVMGANYFENEVDETETGHDKPRLGVGEDSFVERAILDKNVRIGAGVQIRNREGLQEGEGPNFYIRDGIVVIPNGAVIPDGTVI
ncbi:MAG: glucose-1-phosphate adenylyltransferase [Gemmataceae bacterium]